MLSLRCPASSPSWSPTSPQLRFCCRCRQPSSSSAFPRVRFAPLPRRKTLGGGGVVRSRNGSNPSTDSFAGWSETGTGGDEPIKKGGIGGSLGSGLAGLFFAAGVTFATLTLVNKNASVSKQQMEPLTREQEILIISDDTKRKDKLAGSEIHEVLPHEEIPTNNYKPNNITGTVNHLTASTEIIGDAVDSREIHMPKGISLVRNDKAADKSIDILSRVSREDDIKILEDADNSLLVGSIDSQYLSMAHADEFSSDSCMLSNTEIVTDELDSSAGNYVGIDNDEVHVLWASVNNVSPNKIGSDHVGKLYPIAESPLHLLNEFEGQPTKLEISESVGSMYSQLFSENVVEISVLYDREIDRNDKLQLHTEASTNTPVTLEAKEINSLGTNLPMGSSKTEKLVILLNPTTSPEASFDDNGSSIADSILISADPSQEAPDLDQDSETFKESSFESVPHKRTSSHSGIPAPYLVSAALQVPPGKALFPPLVNHVQAQAFAALQVLKVIDNDLQPGDICTRREYARWLVTASSVLSRTPAFKVYPSTYLENLTELAFDDVTLEDPDFKYIQGLAEAGIISSKLSLSDTNGPNSQLGCVYFYPDSPLSRQDLVSWKMALERVQLPEVDKNYLYQCTGYLDVDKINPDAWPAIIADFSAGEQGITALAFGYTRLFHPDKPVIKAQAAIALVTSIAAEVVSEELARVDAESLAEAVVDSDTALVSEVEKDINASYEKELAMEKEKIEALEKLAEDARAELEKLRTQREEEKDELIRGRAAPESEIGVLSTLRHEVEEQLQSLMSYKLEISYERERINKLRKEAENQNQVIAKLQYELEVERKALSLARSWAEEEAKKARAQARVLEEARERWEKRGLRIIVGEDLQDDALVGTTWLTAGEQAKIDETITSGETLVEKLKEMATEIKLRSSAVIERFIEKIIFFISILKQQVWDCSKNAMELMNSSISRVKSSVDSSVSRVKISKNEFQENASSFGLVLKDKASRIIVDCKEGVEKITQKFKR